MKKIDFSFYKKSKISIQSYRKFKMKYICRNHSKYFLKIHIVLVVKYRIGLLIQLGGFIKEEFRKIANNKGFVIEYIESDRDHIHLLISYNPLTNVFDIVKSLKQISTYNLWKSKYYPLLKKNFWKQHTFWSRGYFCCSIGEVSQEVIKNYIENQGK